ncbi:MAG: DUF1080 domain-containing protein [Thermoguttaceae bacterium]
MRASLFLPAMLIALAVIGVLRAADSSPPPGFTPLFDGTDLAGWRGLLKPPLDNPRIRARLKKAKIAAAQKEADQAIRRWRIENGEMTLTIGPGRSLATVKDYGDFELYADWKIGEDGESGIGLRGCPGVQLCDPFTKPTAPDHQAGSGGLASNQFHPATPSKVADKPIGQWNSLYIKMVGDRVTVKINGELVVDNVVLENHWDRSKPIARTGPIEVLHHHGDLSLKNIYVREISEEK